MKEIKKYRLFVNIAGLKISVKKDLEKHRTGEKSRNIFVRIAKVILLLITDFTV